MNDEQMKIFNTLPNAMQKGLQCVIKSYEDENHSAEQLTQQFLDDSAFYGFAKNYYFLADVIRCGGYLRQKPESPINFMEVLSKNFGKDSMQDVDNSLLIFETLIKNNLCGVTKFNDESDVSPLTLEHAKHEICDFYIKKVSQLGAADRDKFFKLADKYDIFPPIMDTYGIMILNDNDELMQQIHDRDILICDGNYFGHSLITHAAKSKKEAEQYIELFDYQFGDTGITNCER